MTTTGASSAAEAIAAAFCADRPRIVGYYDGDLRPPLGQAEYDAREGVWAVRVQEEDVPYSCGADCCGWESYAVVAVDGSPR